MGKSSRATAKNTINRAWSAVYARIRRLDSNVTIKPKMSADIFVIDDQVQDGIHFKIKPIVLTVPQKIASRSGRRLYVVVEGKIVFTPEQRSGLFTTSSFATNIGYFRETGDKIQHVYGAHFDFEPNLVAHPVFHSQIASNIGLFDVVRRYHYNIMELQPGPDLMKQVLGNVRLPTAQMDFFAVLLQVCSDHLINGNLDKSQHSDYEKLRKDSSFFLGYGANHTGLLNSRSDKCHRSPYWYDHTDLAP